jgi:NSS family neurotransmitter:Na+ symporter
LVIFISIYSIFLKNIDAEGVTRTGLQGWAIYFKPDFEGLTFGGFLRICLDAVGQLFYSLSIAMGIMIAYGSYMKKDENLVKSVNKIEIFDTGIALLAGLMIIPAVFVFVGPEGLKNAGPGLIFKILPVVFDSMGGFGTFIGIIFFVTVFFAALTSAVSILEAITSSMMDKFGWSRKKATLVMAAAGFVVSVIVCLGYNVWAFSVTFATVKEGQILDILDYVSNNFLMPIIGILTCILIGWVAKPKYVIDEVTANGEKFGRKNVFIVMIKFVTPVLLLFLLLSSFGLF